MNHLIEVSLIESLSEIFYFLFSPLYCVSKSTARSKFFNMNIVKMDGLDKIWQRSSCHQKFSPQLPKTLTVIVNRDFREHKIGIIANFVFPYFCSFLLYLHHLMLVNVELDISGFWTIKFQGYRLCLSCSFLTA